MNNTSSAFRRLHAWFTDRPAWVPTAISVGLLLLLGYFDYLTGPELSFSIFYLVPVGLTAWYARRTPGIVISAFGALVWYGADSALGHSYAHRLIPVWNTGVRLGFFLIFTYLLSEVHRKLDQEERFADTDTLTGVLNSRAFREALHTEADRSRRYKRPFTLAYIDLDNFKHVNDTAGHGTGDLVLKTVTAYTREHTRRTDTLARLGGDEFALLLPETAEPSARDTLEKLRSGLVEAMQEQGWPVTFSIGAVTFTAPPPTIDEAIGRADALMYDVKKNGKNAVRTRVL